MSTGNSILDGQTDRGLNRGLVLIFAAGLVLFLAIVSALLYVENVAQPAIDNSKIAAEEGAVKIQEEVAEVKESKAEYNEAREFGFTAIANNYGVSPTVAKKAQEKISEKEMDQFLETAVDSDGDPIRSPDGLYGWDENTVKEVYFFKYTLGNHTVWQAVWRYPNNGYQWAQNDY